MFFVKRVQIIYWTTVNTFDLQSIIKKKNLLIKYAYLLPEKLNEPNFWQELIYSHNKY